jgi:hypothetical protein
MLAQREIFALFLSIIILHRLHSAYAFLCIFNTFLLSHFGITVLERSIFFVSSSIFSYLPLADTNHN